MPCGEITTIPTVCGKLLTLPVHSSVFYETLRMFPSVWLSEVFQLFAIPTSWLYRQVINIPRLSEEDTTLTVGNAAGEKLIIPVLKGARIIIDPPGLHYNRGGFYYWFGNDWFLPFFFLWSSLLERSSFFQTCSILRRLAKRCVHTVQRWWVLLTRGPLKCSFFYWLSRPSRLSRKKVNLLFWNLIKQYLIKFLKRFSETEAVAALTMLVSHYKITIKEEPQFAGETFEQRKTRVLKCWNGLTLTWVFLKK